MLSFAFPNSSNSPIVKGNEWSRLVVKLSTNGTAVPFVDSLTTNLDHSLPLTIGEFDEFGNAKDNKEHFEYIYSYAPYNNIKKMDYPNILITTSLSDNRVLFDEPLKFTAKLRDNKTDNNLLLLKTEMNAGHGGKSGRDGIIEEIAFDYAFICKIAKKI